MGLVFQTVLFAGINVLVGALLLAALSSASEFGDYQNNFSDTSDNIKYSDVNSIQDYKPSQSTFDSLEVPSWFSYSYLLVMGLWGSFIIIGWIRGQD